MLNRLLARLPEPILGRCRSEFREVSLARGDELESAGSILSAVVFPCSGVLSIFAGRDQGGVEVGMVGREGMTGLPALYGCDLSSHSVVVQIPGAALEMPSGPFRALLEREPDLRRVVLRYAHAQVAQISHCGLANARSTVTERVARWLLMCSDRAGDLDICVTHEALSEALGVRRPGVTVATHILEGQGAIRAKRGSICVLDRQKLRRCANGSYGAAEREYDSLFGRSQPSPSPAESRYSG